eukprot:scaffold18684_cov121-Isochrysis_galbana.AAC.6
MSTVVSTAATARALEYLSVLMLRREHRPMHTLVEQTLRETVGRRRCVRLHVWWNASGAPSF